ncbi:MAG: hypothetical protein GYB36_12880 [Alphaproteobacteria bacterium]|nr:hypothetical protein [Alphaproteobacteria bacterium]
MARVTLTDDIIGELERLKRETGLGPMKLLARSDNVPQGLNSAIINTWLNRKTESARADHLEFVLAAYRAVPPVIPITDELRAQLNEELARTGHTPTSLLNALRPYPKALNAALVSRWSTGRTVSAKGELWRFVMDGLKALPNAK